MSPTTISVSIETGSKFFRFQLGLIDRLIDHTVDAASPRHPRWFEAERRDLFLRGLLKAKPALGEKPFSPDRAEFSVSIGTET